MTFRMSRPPRWLCACSLWLLCPTVALAQPAEKKDDAPSSANLRGNWRPYVPPDESLPSGFSSSPPPPGTPSEPYEPEGDIQGLGLLGLEAVAGSSRAGASEGGAGVQAGMRFPFLIQGVNVDLHGLLGVGVPFAPIGELRFAFDSDAAPKKPRNRLLRWGIIGFETRLLGLPGLWLSYVEIPRFHVGISRLRNRQGLDAGLRIGWTWVGRYNPAQTSRDLGFTLSPSAYLTAYRGLAFFKAEARAFVSPEPSRPVSSAEGSFCFAFPSEISFCASAGLLTGEAKGASESLSSLSWRAGLMLGGGARLGYKLR